MRAISWERWILPALAMLTFTAFCQVGQHDFVNYDDPLYVYRNSKLAQGLTTAGITWSFTALQVSNWHPLTWLSYLVDYELYGLRPGGYHLTNLLLHIAATLLLFSALRRMTGAVWRSAFVAALFAWHPLHVESVAWISERKDVLSAVFWMLGLWTYTHYAARPSWRRYSLLAGCLALGLMAKPMLVTFPLVLLLLDYWPLGRCGSSETGERLEIGRAVRLFCEKLPLLALSAASAWITLKAQRDALIPADELPFALRAGNALVSYVGYLGKTIWPHGLSFHYPHPGDALSALPILGASALLLGASAGAFALRRRAPYLLVGWLWYLGTLVPVIGLVQVGVQAMADRYTYLPLVGLFVAGVWGTADLARRLRVGLPIVASGAAGVLGILFALTWIQVGHWQNSFTLCEQALRVTERNDVAHFNLASAHTRYGSYDKAIEHFRRVIEINPRNYRAHGRVAFLLAARGQEEQSKRHRAAALWLISETADQRVRTSTPGSPEGELARKLAHGRTLAERGLLDRAASEFEQVLAVDPASLGARLALGSVLLASRQHEQAMERFREVLRLSPGEPAAHYKLGIALIQLGRFEEADSHLSAAAQRLGSHRRIRALLAGLQSRQGM